MTERSERRNAFEFVTVASARAKQLLRGCPPRTETPSPKKARVAMKEVKAGLVKKDDGR